MAQGFHHQRGHIPARSAAQRERGVRSLHALRFAALIADPFVDEFRQAHNKGLGTMEVTGIRQSGDPLVHRRGFLGKNRRQVADDDAVFHRIVFQRIRAGTMRRMRRQCGVEKPPHHRIDLEHQLRALLVEMCMRDRVSENIARPDHVGPRRNRQFQGLDPQIVPLTRAHHQPVRLKHDRLRIAIVRAVNDP